MYTDMMSAWAILSVQCELACIPDDLAMLQGNSDRTTAWKFFDGDQACCWLILIMHSMTAAVCPACVVHPRVLSRQALVGLCWLQPLHTVVTVCPTRVIWSQVGGAGQPLAPAGAQHHW